MYSEIQIALSNHRLETSSEKVKASGILLQNGMYKIRSDDPIMLSFLLQEPCWHWIVLIFPSMRE